MHRTFAVTALIFFAVGLPRARAEVVEQKPVSPRVLEWLAVEVSAAPISFSFWLGGHTWIADRYLVGLRAAGKRSSLERDLNGDGQVDFSATLGNNPIHFEVQADFGYPLISRDGFTDFGSGARVTRRDASGRETTTWTELRRVPHTCELSLVSGARAAVASDEFQVGVPLGLRYSYRLKARGKQFKEWWYQARAIMFLPALKPGVDAELTWMPRNFGVAIFAEYIPKLGDTDPDGEQCSFAPQTCSPATPITVFNRVPDKGMLQIGVRLRLTRAF